MNHMVLTTMDNVRGRMAIYPPVAGGGWTHRKLELPDNSSLGVAAADDRSDRAFVSVNGFLTTSSLLTLDTATGAMAPSKALPPKFDASKDEVEQHEATSTDGTKIPYFIV